jgi:diguanylate cyclase (GGDEF)-like protein/PAS domain S-box-containing protein
MPNNKKNPASQASDGASRQTALTISLSALREREAGLRRAQLMANLSHVITGPDGSFESWSDTLPNLIGCDPQRMVESTRKWLELIHPEDRALFRDTALAARAQATRADVDYRLKRDDGSIIHVRQVMEPIPGPADTRGRLRWFNTIQDVSVQKRAEERIRRLNRVHGVLSGINTLIVRVRDRQELFNEACSIAIRHGGFRMAWLGLVDPAGLRVEAVAWAGDVRDFFDQAPLGLSPARPGYGLVGRALKNLRTELSLDVRNDPLPLMKEACAQRGINSFAIIPLVVSGKAQGVLALYAADAGFFDEEEMRLLQELAGDVSFAMEHIEKSEQAEYLAYHDPITGLANRKLFHERLAQHATGAAEQQRKFALVILDIERFKTINDTFGRHAGDALLKDIAERMLRFAPQARIARVAGDHFAILTRDVVSEDELARRTERRLEEFFGAPYRVRDENLRISAKAGIALFPDDAADGETLFRNAEAALKKAKQAGERMLFYEQQMTERVSEKLALENKLRQALENEEFVLHYQPKVDFETRSIQGVEALIRWQSPELGLVPPLRFIHLLEETGLILAAGSWALRRASLDHRNWVEQGFKGVRVAVNVSQIQLRQRDFVKVIEDAIIEGIAPTGIDLEITESLVMQDVQANIEKLNSVRGLGINLAIDDFGTGYSSLGYLAKLPVQFLKIDRSFISAMQDDADAMTLVSTIISLAHSLRLKVIAEGVETEEQAKILRLLRCDEMQGYLVSKPLPVDQLLALLRKPS